MESEFVSAAREIQEAMGCNHLVKEMGQSIKFPGKLRVENQAAIASIMNEVAPKTKQVGIKHILLRI